jgi:hypothetical protein
MHQRTLPVVCDTATESLGTHMQVLHSAVMCAAARGAAECSPDVSLAAGVLPE